MQCLLNKTAYSNTAVSYYCKMFMTLATGAQVITHFFLHC
jgi:hypothetical protein